MQADAGGDEGNPPIVSAYEHPLFNNSPENIERRRRLKIAEHDPVNGYLLKGSVLAGAGKRTSEAALAGSITIAARQHTQAAIDVLAGMLTDPKAPHAAKVQAASALLDRGYGKAPIQIDVNVKARFDDFLRDVGAHVTYEHVMTQPAIQIGVDAGVNAAIASAIEDEARDDDEHNE